MVPIESRAVKVKVIQVLLLTYVGRAKLLGGLPLPKVTKPMAWGEEINSDFLHTDQT